MDMKGRQRKLQQIKTTIRGFKKKMLFINMRERQRKLQQKK
jgi:hypothetical protein